ncbi:MAG TPA: DEAD/DEAH box helicase, partial [Pirellulaceae bacterium]|nr:DEAD/DEAH box helicase [Pirellulaceae bacterium]
MPLDNFHPLVREWFSARFGEPTEPQRMGWPHISAGRHTLIAAPTGSGKTLAAFLVCLNRLWQDWLDGKLTDGVRVVYVSPLKALSNDIERNLQQPLAELCELALQRGILPPPIRTAVRTGDTPSATRQKMLRVPPHILVTTPESLYLMLTSEKSREVLRTVDTVIVDEIHALARDKRGSHLSLTLERLADLCENPPVRIGLSATQRPIEDIARFLVGTHANPITHVETPTVDHYGKDDSGEDVFLVDGGHSRDLDLAVEVPPSELSAVCSNEQWGEVYERLVELIQSHRSTLIFVNTRRLAERVSHHLREVLGDDAVAGHHGSLAKELRHSAEQRLKNGELNAIVATASLEMGIDVGYIDLVCQVGSPRAIATFLQRVGRSGHSLGLTPKGRLFPLTRDELLECMSLVRAVRRGELDRIEIPNAPLDILAQQIVATVACDEWEEDSLFELCRRAWPYRHLSRKQFDEVVEMLASGLTAGTKRGLHLHRDRINGRVRARRGARLAAITSGGAIPDTAEYRVVTELDKTFVGTLDEDFAIESMAGDVFLLGNTSWRVQQIRSGEVIVRDAEGAPPSVPFWFGEGPGRTIELSAEVSRLRRDIAVTGLALREECSVSTWAAEQATNYI